MRLIALSLACAVIAAPTAACSAPDEPSQEDMVRMARELQASHIAANVPDADDFMPFLRRDLIANLKATGVDATQLDIDFLRNGPTQSGVAYPKFYIWIVASRARGTLIQGAVRVAAIEKQRFEVTDLMSAEQIRAHPEQVGAVFPAPLVASIKERADASAP